MVIADKLRRPTALAAASLLFVASLVPLVNIQTVNAYGLLGDRYIQMSSSADGTTPDGQGVTYEVGFDPISGTDIAGVVVDFCAGSPIIGDACTGPTGFDVDSATLNLGTGLTGFTVDATATTANKFVITGTAVAPGATVDFEIDGVTNPSNTNTTFYARILTFSTEAGAENYTSTAIGSEPPLLDAGGIALSTTAQITITAKVQERLTFCVYTLADCSAGGTQITLGDDNGVLRDNGAFVDKNTRYDVSTNAATGAALRIKGETLESGTSGIDAIGGTAAASATGTEQFGFCTYESTGAGMTVNAPYTGGAGAECAGTTQSAGTNTPGGTGTATFAFDTNGTTGTTSVYGQQFASKPAGDSSTGTIAFLGNIAATTEAGIYTTTLTFIATGTY